MYKKSEFFKNSFSFLIKTAYFTQKWNFFIRVDILISCPSFSRILHNSTQKHRKIRHFSRGIWLIIHDLHFLILTCLHKNHSFSLALPSEGIAIDELGSIALKHHTYTTFFLLKFIFHKKLQVEVGYIVKYVAIYMVFTRKVILKHFDCGFLCLGGV